jgi:hypothetical protein
LGSAGVPIWHREAELDWLRARFPQFKRIIPWDTEFRAGGGNRPIGVCFTAWDLYSGEEWQQFEGEFGPKPPFPIDDETLFVGFYNSADLGFHTPSNLLRSAYRSTVCPSGFSMV